MKIQHFDQIPAEPVQTPGAADCTIRWLISKQDGAPTFAMRQFDIAPGGHTPLHSHAWEHEVYILRGTGVVMQGDRERPFQAGTAIYVEPGEPHQFRNTGNEPVRMLCLVPNGSY